MQAVIEEPGSLFEGLYLEEPPPSLEDEIDPRQLSSEQLVARGSHCYQMKTHWDLELMKVLAEVEERCIYEDDGYDSTASWAASTFGIGFTRACEYVEVATCLSELPRLEAAYGEGRLSYDHLRALVKVADPENEKALLEEVEGLSVKDTFNLVHKILGVSKEDSVRTRAERWLEMSWEHESRMLHLWANLPEEMGAKVEKALNALAKKMPDEPEDQGPTPMGVKRADALAEMASSALASHPSRPTVVVHVDVEALATGEGTASIEGGPLISAETARRLACDSRLQVVLENGGRPLAAGRSRRSPNEKLLRQLYYRDRGCRFPQCPRQTGLHSHHIVHWPKGETELDNLVLLCDTHHHFVHEGGYSIRGDPPKIWVEKPGHRPIKNGPPNALTK